MKCQQIIPRNKTNVICAYVQPTTRTRALTSRLPPALAKHPSHLHGHDHRPSPPPAPAQRHVRWRCQSHARRSPVDVCWVCARVCHVRRRVGVRVRVEKKRRTCATTWRGHSHVADACGTHYGIRSRRTIRPAQIVVNAPFELAFHVHVRALQPERVFEICPEQAVEHLRWVRAELDLAAVFNRVRIIVWVAFGVVLGVGNDRVVGCHVARYLTQTKVLGDPSAVGDGWRRDGERGVVFWGGLHNSIL